MTESDIVKTIFIAAAPTAVWSYLTEKDRLAEWFHPADADLAPGKAYALLGADEDGTGEPQCWGTVIEMIEPTALVYSFTIKPLGGAMTTVSWALEAVAGGTRLTLTHSGIASAVEAGGALGLLMALDEGWDKHLGRLRATVR